MHVQLEEKKWNKKTLEKFHLKRWRLGVWSRQCLFCPLSLFVQTSHHYFLSHHETLAQEPHTRSTKTSKHELKLKNYQNQEFPSFTLPFFLFCHVQTTFDESSCLLPEHWVYTLSFHDYEYFYCFLILTMWRFLTQLLGFMKLAPKRLWVQFFINCVIYY
jgi:hypothetical protein